MTDFVLKAVRFVLWLWFEAAMRARSLDSEPSWTHPWPAMQCSLGGRCFLPPPAVLHSCAVLPAPLSPLAEWNLLTAVLGPGLSRSTCGRTLGKERREDLPDGTSGWAATPWSPWGKSHLWCWCRGLRMDLLPYRLCAGCCLWSRDLVCICGCKVVHVQHLGHLK